MKEIKGDIFDLMKGDFQAFCITTNGFVKKNGECVMGRGIAQKCRDRFNGIAKDLGSLINQCGNHVWYLGHYEDGDIISFPVKHHWSENADMKLIERSAHELMRLLEHAPHVKKVLLPRPGCGNGKLDWKDVKPVIENILDDRIYVASFGTEDVLPNLPPKQQKVDIHDGYAHDVFCTCDDCIPY